MLTEEALYNNRKIKIVGTGTGLNGSFARIKGAATIPLFGGSQGFIVEIDDAELKRKLKMKYDCIAIPNSNIDIRID